MNDLISRRQVLPLGSDAILRRGFQVVSEELPSNFRSGKLLEVLDKLAEDVALTYAREQHPDPRVVTAAVDQIQVLAPADIRRDIVLWARLNFVGRTSVEVGIRVEHPANTEDQRATHIASCYFTMVVRSPDGTQSLPLLPFEPEDEIAQKRWAKAIDRRDSQRRRLTDAQRPPSHDDFEVLSELHAAQEDKAFNGLRAERLQTSSWERMFPEHENVPRKIFGGYLIRKAYEQSSLCAEMLAPHRPILVSVNRINFNQPVRIGDKLHFQSRIVYTGHCSICVEANILRVSRDRVGSALSNTCVFTFVNVDAELKAQAVPRIYPTTYREDASYLAARRRHFAYREWKAAGKP